MVTILTPTRDQPTGIALCERWLRAQTVWNTLPLQWIVVDDGIVPADLTLSQTHLRRPAGDAGPTSLCSNLLRALSFIEGEIVVVCEHDDYYAPTHLERILEQFHDGVDLAGDDQQRYYHVGLRRWRIFQNRGASLCQTAFRRELIPTFADVLQRCLLAQTYGVDAALWTAVGEDRKSLQRTETVVGIKGVPGPQGLGIGHRPDVVRKWIADADGATLREWIGADASVYAPFGTAVPV